MTDFYEIDFRQVHTAKSGDAIGVRYQIGQYWFVHLVDGGYATTAPEISNFIRQDYGTNIIHNVVVTHPDRDHAEGLAPILEKFDVRALWMLRPWDYAAHLLPYFPRYQTVDALATRLREEYPYIYELEKIALRRSIQMFEPFQGAKIGAFTVLAPSPTRYLQLVVQSDKTPQTGGLGILGGLMQAAAPIIRFIKAGWGSEKFSSEATSVENEMSVIQYAVLCGDKIVLTGDAGRDGMTEAANFAPNVGLLLPGVNKFQVPHHGGRRNLSTEVLDRWVGPRLAQKLPDGQERFTAMISSAKEDPDHPRKAVLRGLLHRGAFILTTEDRPAVVHRNSARSFTVVSNVAYPDEQEED
jgi:beta-lactamase superfamily II metal-dependent hydrolase